MEKVVLNQKGEEKVKSLNLLIYRPEIKKSINVKEGSLVEIFSPKGKFLAIGYINKNSKIPVRILTFKKEKIDKNFFEKKIKNAIKKRKNLEKITNSYRLIHSEADYLPGLIVDKYDKYLSIQFNTAGIYRFKETILQILIDLLNPQGIFQKCDEKISKIENIPCEEKIIFGIIPENIIIKENNINFEISLQKGQKTGFFLDQRRNRKIISCYVEKGFNVLDLFSNVGGFGIYAYKNGASHVDFVDISKDVKEKIEKNCKLNSIKKYKIHIEDAFDFIKKTDKKYNLIIIDPPPFAKSKYQKEGAIKGFQYLLINSINLLKENGYIALFSCSHNINENDLKRVMLFSSEKTKRYIKIIEHLYQDLDHPYILNIPNSLYLRGYLIKVE